MDTSTFRDRKFDEMSQTRGTPLVSGVTAYGYSTPIHVVVEGGGERDRGRGRGRERGREGEGERGIGGGRGGGGGMEVHTSDEEVHHLHMQ